MQSFIKHKVLPVVFILSLGLYACSEKKHDHDQAHHHEEAETTGNPQADSLKQQVMAVHDEVMPKMDEIMSLRMAAQHQVKQLDSIAKANPKLANVSQKAQLDSLIVELDEADEAMMQWMQKFDGDMKSKSDQEKMEYLKSEQEKISHVRDQMLSSISKGKQLLNR